MTEEERVAKDLFERCFDIIETSGNKGKWTESKQITKEFVSLVIEEVIKNNLHLTKLLQVNQFNESVLSYNRQYWTRVNDVILKKDD